MEEPQDALALEQTRAPSHVQPQCTIYPLGCYKFGTKEAQPEEDPSVAARLQRLANEYERSGLRQTVEAVLVVHEHGHPHVLMLQIANTFFKLPGKALGPGEDEVTGLCERLNQQLAPPGVEYDWSIGELLANWWRPNFETFMYPYVPAHITRPKERKRLFLVNLPDQLLLSVPKNMKLLAVPLFELYDNSARYGPQLSALPHLLSRIYFDYADPAFLSPGPGDGVGDEPADDGVNGAP